MAVHLETRHSRSFLHFDRHALSSYRDALVIGRMAVDVAERDVQHRHLYPGVRQDRPCAKDQEEPGCNAERDDQDETEDEPPSGRGEGIVAAGGINVLRRFPSGDAIHPRFSSVASTNKPAKFSTARPAVANRRSAAAHEKHDLHQSLSSACAPNAASESRSASCAPSG